MKVILVNSFYNPHIFGGAEISTELLARSISSAGHDVVILTSNPESHKLEKEFIDGIKVYRMNPCNPVTNQRQTKHPVRKSAKIILNLWNFFAYSISRRIMREEAPDVVHTNNLYDLSPAIWSAAKSLDLPIVHTIRDYDLLCLKENSIANLACEIYKRIKFSPKMHIDVVTFISHFLRNKYKDKWGFDRIRQEVVYNAVELDEKMLERHIKVKLGRRKQPMQFLFMGRSGPIKGLDLLLEAFKELFDEGLRNIRLNVLSDVNQEYIRDYHCPAIRYYGFLSGQHKEAVMLESDVAIMPSIWDEPFGRSVIEAFSYAIPVIGSSAGAIPELIDDGKDGLVFHSGNKNDLKKKITQFVSHPQIINEFIMNSAKKAKKFSHEAQRSVFLSIYESIRK